MWQKLRSSKTRLISSFVIISFVVPLLLLNYYVDVFHYIGLIVFSVFGIYSLYEVYNVLGIRKGVSIFCTLIIIPFLFLAYDPEFLDLLNYPGAPLTMRMLWAFGDWRSYLIVGLGCFIPLIVDGNFRSHARSLILSQTLVTIVTFITVIFVKALWVINIHSIIHIVFFILVGVVADTFAYLGGILLGGKWKAKLAPTISPNKTWVGFIVGLIATLVFTILVGYYLDIWKNIGTNGWVIAIVAGIVLSVVAPLGDLFFSAIKRYAKVKDFSEILPGHGGIYDRVDALALVIVCGSLVYIVYS